MSNAAFFLLPLVTVGVVAAAALKDDVADDGRAAEWTRAPSPASTSFTVIGPGKITVEGKTDKLEVEETEQHVVVVVGLQTLSTGDPVRDKVMLDHHLEVEKYPEARLEVLRADLRLPQQSGVTLVADTRGTLFLHGKEKEVAFHYEGTCNAAWLCDVVGKSTVVMTDFDIPLPVWRGSLLRPDVAVATQFQVQRTPAPVPPPDTEPEPPPTLPQPPIPSPGSKSSVSASGS